MEWVPGEATLGHTSLSKEPTPLIVSSFLLRHGYLCMNTQWAPAVYLAMPPPPREAGAVETGDYYITEGLGSRGVTIS